MQFFFRDCIVSFVGAAFICGQVAITAVAQESSPDETGLPAAAEQDMPAADQSAVPAVEEAVQSAKTEQPAAPSPVEKTEPDDEMIKSAKKLLRVSGKPSKLFAKEKAIAITQFNTEFGYAHRKETASYIKSSKLKIDTEDYQMVTEEMFASFTEALQKYGWLEVVPKEKIISHPKYKSMGGSEGPKDSKDQWASTRKVGGQGTETVTCSPEGMKVAQAFRAAAQKNLILPEVASSAGAKFIMDVNIFVDYNEKKDMPVIVTSTININDVNVRQKMIPFKGPVPGEYVYEPGTQFIVIELKEPVSTETKVSDRVTKGFFKQGKGNVDVSTMTGAIIRTFERVAILQAAALHVSAK
jgi:hypothetical protein